MTSDEKLREEIDNAFNPVGYRSWGRMLDWLLARIDVEKAAARLEQHVCDCHTCQGIEPNHYKCPRGMALCETLAAKRTRLAELEGK